ncbi:MAG: FAD:protein FMN transferase [Planctomycetes bacterium]|nr:FAD:protein FMN transferase [Planctomycetota bacterium]
MRAALILSVILALAPHAAAQSADELRAIEHALPAGARIAKELVLFTPTERERIARAAGLEAAPRTLRVFAARDEQGLAGLAVLGDAPGKCQPITYLLVTDAAVRVRSVEILAYREGHGGQVRDERWRAQFAGKDASSALRLSDDIRNIAGATISCRSITDAVRRDVQMLAVARAELARRDAAAVEARGAEADGAGSSGVLVRSRLLMGTTFTIETRGGDERARAAAYVAAFERVAELERCLSDWDDTSEASALSRAPVGTWSALSEPLGRVLERALHWQRASAGAFDPCLGALTRLARSDAARLPDDAELARARASTGPGALEFEPGRARLVRSGARLDLGGIGKGFALECAAEELERRGVHSALLDFGGQVLALDPPPCASGWEVRLRDPRHPEATLGSRLLVRCSVATTADYERGRVVDGTRVSHVLDPRTGRPVEGMLGAIVLHASATDADALSTTLFVLGAEAGERFARANGLEAWLFPAEGEPRCTLHASDAPGTREAPRRP